MQSPTKKELIQKALRLMARDGAVSGPFLRSAEIWLEGKSVEDIQRQIRKIS